MIILGIETSCDETSCAVLKADAYKGTKGGAYCNTFLLLSNITATSLARHQPFGGVVPEIAARACLESIDPVFAEAAKKAGIRVREIDLVAVTRGPGLIGSLLVGMNFGKALAYALGVPLVGVNHLEAHLDANFLEAPFPRQPFVGLVVSGGHTLLLYNKEGEYQKMGETVDDAAGEAFDKVAKLLGLRYPGGPEIDRIAKEGDPEAFKFTRPKMDGRFDFSFSGIKTAVSYLVKGKRDGSPKNSSPLVGEGRWGGRNFSHPPSPLRSQSFATVQQGLTPPMKGGGKTLAPSLIADIAASFQKAVVSWLVEKTLLACREKKAKLLVTGGGVMANSLLRKQFEEACRREKVRLFIPPLWLTGDNASMIARSGLEKFRRAPENYSEGNGFYRMAADPALAI